MTEFRGEIRKSRRFLYLTALLGLIVGFLYSFGFHPPFGTLNNASSDVRGFAYISWIADSLIGALIGVAIGFIIGGLRLRQIQLREAANFEPEENGAKDP